MQKNQRLKNWRKFRKQNSYYHDYIVKQVKQLIPEDASVLEFGSKGGEILSSLRNKRKTGVEFDNSFESLGRNKKFHIIYGKNYRSKLRGKKFDYILVSYHLNKEKDVQQFIRDIGRYVHDRSRIIVFYFNFLWKPALDLAENLNLKYPEEEQNWLSEADIDNFLYLENYRKINSNRRLLLPYDIPIFSNLINTYFAPLPLFNQLSMINYSIYSPLPQRKKYSVSLVIPARNEEGNIKGIFRKIPKFTKDIEIIFIEGHSKDDTYKVIKKEVKNYKGPYKPSLFKQRGKGKGDAVRLGFSKAKNELLMILDADLTVDPNELPKFYRAACEGKGDLVMGSRLIYPMESQAMRALNVLGNKFFSVAFTFLLDQRIKDTLCGTKVILKSDYEKIAKNRKMFGDFDPFGDYDLIFGAAKLNMKIVEIPIRYRERTYGSTNISRFTHGWLLLKMAYFAAKNLKFT